MRSCTIAQMCLCATKINRSLTSKSPPTPTMTMVNGNAIYHQRQSMEMCLMHALNNLFQGQAFNKAALDQICKNLSPDTYSLTNPHRSMLGSGNYDVNVLLAALATKGCTAVWHDRRRAVVCIDLDNVVGFVLNTPSQPTIGGFIPIPFVRRKHWVALRYIGGAYYNLDSKHSEPVLIGESDEFLRYLQEKSDAEENQLFIVVSEEHEKNMTYLHPPYRNNTAS